MTEYEYQILLVFHKSSNTEYWILFGIKKIWIPNTKYSSILRKSEYQIQIVLFGITIWKPNNKYRIVQKKFWKKSAKINIFISYKTFGETIWTDIWTGIWIPKYYLGCKKTTKYQIPNIIRYWDNQSTEFRILLFGLTIRIVFKYQIICHTLSLRKHWFCSKHKKNEKKKKKINFFFIYIFWPTITCKWWKTEIKYYVLNPIFLISV